MRTAAAVSARVATAARFRRFSDRERTAVAPMSVNSEASNSLCRIEPACTDILRHVVLWIVAVSSGAPVDESRFDTLARALSTAGSRRRALAGLAAGGLG